MAAEMIGINNIMKSNKKGKVYPHIWKSGPDPVVHQLWLDCQRAKAQAKFRGQEWQIQEQEYVDLWMQDDKHLHKGRSSKKLCMTRIDKTKPWSRHNVQFVTREDFYREKYSNVPRYERGTEVVK